MASLANGLYALPAPPQCWNYEDFCRDSLLDFEQSLDFESEDWLSTEVFGPNSRNANYSQWRNTPSWSSIGGVTDDVLDSTPFNWNVGEEAEQFHATQQQPLFQQSPLSPVRSTIEGSPSCSSPYSSSPMTPPSPLSEYEQHQAKPPQVIEDYSSNNNNNNNNNKKRKLSTSKSEDYSLADDSPTQYHRKVEQKYRKKLLTNLERLRASVPSLLAKNQEPPSEKELLGLRATRKQSKATTIYKATEFIEHIKKQHRSALMRAEEAEAKLAGLKAENEVLRFQIEAVS